jgi:hypothetical protein
VSDLATSSYLLNYFLTILLSNNQSSSKYFPTGLEPVTCVSPWYPDSGTISGRPVEGFNLLTRMPIRGEVSDEDELVLLGRLRPKPFKEGVSDDFMSKKHTLLLHFDMDGSQEPREAWVRWFDSNAPTNDNVFEYISSHHYRCPFSAFFESDTCYGRTDHWSKPVGAAVDEFISIFPSATVVALPTVRTSHTRMYPVAPYMLVEDGLALFKSTIISRFNQHVMEHISKLYDCPRYTLVILRAIVHRRLLSNGSLPAISDRKKTELALMIPKWIAEDFLTARFRDVSREDKQLNGKLLDRPEEIDRINPDEVTLIGDLPLSLLDMHSLLGTSTATNQRIIDAFMLLCRQRDAAVIDCYQQIHERGGRHFKERKASVFLSADTVTALLSTEISLEAKVGLLPETLLSSYNLYIPVVVPRIAMGASLGEEPEHWVLVAAIMSQKPAPTSPPTAAAPSAADGDGALPPPPPPPPFPLLPTPSSVSVFIALDVYRPRFVDDSPSHELKTAREAYNEDISSKLKTVIESFASTKLVPITISWVPHTTTTAAAAGRGRAANKVISCVGDDRSNRRFDDVEGFEGLPKHWGCVASAADSGIFVMTAIEYMCFDVGFAWEPADMDLLRQHLAGYLLKGELPLF